jgi:hypothetical protein
MASLWQLTQEELSFINLMEENGGEVTDELMEDLAIRRENFSHKAEAYAKFILKLESESDQAAAELKRIQAIKKAKDKTVERLRENLLAALMLFGQEDSKGVRRYETPLAKLSTRKSISVEILDESALAPAFWLIKKEPWKSEISKAIKDGEHVPGAQLSEKIGLSIR